MGDRMEIKLDYAEQLQQIEELIGAMPDLLEKEEKKMLKKIGGVIKKYVVRQLRLIRMPQKETEKRHNYDKTVPYIQMDDDVKVSVKKSKSGLFYVSVKGGKYTGYKWHFLNDGTRNKDGSVHTHATHFMDIALRQAGNEIETIINEVLKKVSEYGG